VISVGFEVLNAFTFITDFTRGQPPPSSVEEMSKFITAFCIDQIDKSTHKCNGDDLSVRQIFANTITNAVFQNYLATLLVGPALISRRPTQRQAYSTAFAAKLRANSILCRWVERKMLKPIPYWGESPENKMRRAKTLQYTQGYRLSKKRIMSLFKLRHDCFSKSKIFGMSSISLIPLNSAERGMGESARSVC
jgi:hypothetical protein